MKKFLFKTVALLTVAIMLFSNIAVFADSQKEKQDKKNNPWESRNSVKEYVKEGKITEIKSNIITLWDKSDKSMFKLSDKTTIYNSDNKKIKSSDLKKDMDIEVT